MQVLLQDPLKLHESLLGVEDSDFPSLILKHEKIEFYRQKFTVPFRFRAREWVLSCFSCSADVAARTKSHSHPIQWWLQPWRGFRSEWTLPGSSTTPHLDYHIDKPYICTGILFIFIYTLMFIYVYFYTYVHIHTEVISSLASYPDSAVVFQYNE